MLNTSSTVTSAVAAFYIITSFGAAEAVGGAVVACLFVDATFYVF